MQMFSFRKVELLSNWLQFILQGDSKAVKTQFIRSVAQNSTTCFVFLSNSSACFAAFQWHQENAKRVYI